MVHGTTFSIRYVIVLKTPIDYYDHLLPLRIENRKMFELIQTHPNTLVVFGEYDLKQRFESKQISQEFEEALTDYSYCSYNNSEGNSDKSRSNKLFRNVFAYVIFFSY